jgi:hypothetical protein
VHNGVDLTLLPEGSKSIISFIGFWLRDSVQLFFKERLLFLMEIAGVERDFSCIPSGEKIMSGMIYSRRSLRSSSAGQTPMMFTRGHYVFCE